MMKIIDYTTLVTDYVANGSFASLKKNVQYKKEEDYAVMIRLVDYNSNYNKNFVFIGKDSYNFLRKSKLYGNEIIISNVGANVGTIFKCPKLKYKMSLAPNSIMMKTKGYADFYFYWLKSKFGQFAIKSIVSGSAQPKFNKTDFRSLKIPVPPLQEQKAIAATLSCLDDKIELNNRMNQTLEEMAQAIFKSWFVDFDPFQDGEFVDSKLGRIPKGWGVGRLDDFFDISIGKTPPRKESQWFTKNKKDVNWVSISDMGKSGVYVFKTAEKLTEEAIKKFRIKTVPENTVLLSFKLTVGRVSFTNHEMVTNEAIAHIKTKDKTINEYLYCYLKSFNYERLGNTSSIAKAVNSKVIKAMPIIIPNGGILEKYNNIASELFLQIKKNETQNHLLKQLRNTLLPKLMSGEVRVPIPEVD